MEPKDRPDVTPPTTAACTVGPILAVRAAGKKLAAESRDPILEAAAAGRSVRLEVDAVVYLQPEKRNRNSVRFKPSILKRLAASFVGVPFLRDHEQRDVTARGGTVIASELVEQKGTPAIQQTIELTAPWAVDLALRGLMDRFSIGWSNTADVICSVCDEPYVRSIWGSYPSCNHMPGDVLTDDDGEETFVEMIVTGAEGVEVSAVSVPAVVGTGVDEIRAAALAARSADGNREIQAAHRVREALAANQPPKENIMKNLATKLGLAENADEPTILAAVERLRLDRDSATRLHAAEVEAHAATKTQLAAFEAEREKEAKLARDAKLAGLLAEVRRKTGKQKLDADNKPIDGGTETEEHVIELASLSMERAERFVQKLAQTSPIGQSALSVGTAPPTGVVERAGQLTEQQKRIAKNMKLSEADYLAQLNANAAKEG